MGKTLQINQDDLAYTNNDIAVFVLDGNITVHLAISIELISAGLEIMEKGDCLILNGLSSDKAKKEILEEFINRLKHIQKEL
jgi:hypothetical protein